MILPWSTTTRLGMWGVLLDHVAKGSVLQVAISKWLQYRVSLASCQHCASEWREGYLRFLGWILIILGLATGRPKVQATFVLPFVYHPRSPRLTWLKKVAAKQVPESAVLKGIPSALGFLLWLCRWGILKPRCKHLATRRMQVKQDIYIYTHIIIYIVIYNILYVITYICTNENKNDKVL